LILPTAFACLAVAAATAPMDEPALEQIVVTAQRRAAADAVLEQSVTAALVSHPYFDATHVTVTVQDGIAHLHGVLQDDWDLRIALRTARRIPGVRRVVHDIEINRGGAD
jgi:osmotically-inducible protein OsmY